MTCVLTVIGVWLIASVLVSLLIARFIRFGTTGKR